MQHNPRTLNSKIQKKKNSKYFPPQVFRLSLSFCLCILFVYVCSSCVVVVVVTMKLSSNVIYTSGNSIWVNKTAAHFKKKKRRNSAIYFWWFLSTYYVHSDMYLNSKTCYVYAVCEANTFAHITVHKTWMAFVST